MTPETVAADISRSFCTQRAEHSLLGNAGSKPLVRLQSSCGLGLSHLSA